MLRCVLLRRRAAAHAIIFRHMLRRRYDIARGFTRDTGARACVSRGCHRQRSEINGERTTMMDTTTNQTNYPTERDERYGSVAATSSGHPPTPACRLLVFRVTTARLLPSMYYHAFRRLHRHVCRRFHYAYC